MGNCIQLEKLGNWETLVLLAAKEIVCNEMCVLRDKVKNIEKVSHSNNTVKRRIDDMLLNVKMKLMFYFKGCIFFTLKIYENTDV